MTSHAIGSRGWVKLSRFTEQPVKEKANDSMTSLKELRSTSILYVKRGDLKRKKSVPLGKSFSLSASLELITQLPNYLNYLPKLPDLLTTAPTTWVRKLDGPEKARKETGRRRKRPRQKQSNVPCTDFARGPDGATIDICDVARLK